MGHESVQSRQTAQCSALCSHELNLGLAQRLIAASLMPKSHRIRTAANIEQGRNDAGQCRAVLEHKQNK